MSDIGSTSSLSAGQGPTGGRTVTAFFDTRAAAQQAIDDLVADSVPRDQISLVQGGPEPYEAEAVPSQEKGFWATLKDLFSVDEDRHSYGEGLRRGGFLLAVRDDGTMHDRIIDILDREGTVDMDEREGLWRQEGWSGGTGPGAPTSQSLKEASDAAATGMTASVAPAATDLGATVPTDELREAYKGSPEPPASPGAGDIPPDEATPGRAGQRDRDLGRARVRSYLDEGL